MNFSNPELVSSENKRDKVRLRLEQPLIFQSLETNKTLDNPVLFTAEVPKQVMSVEEQKKIEELGSSTEASVFFFLLLFLALKVFA